MTGDDIRRPTWSLHFSQRSNCVMVRRFYACSFASFFCVLFGFPGLTTAYAALQPEASGIDLARMQTGPSLLVITAPSERTPLMRTAVWA